MIKQHVEEPRPSDRELIEYIAWVHGVSFDTAVRWVSEIDLTPWSPEEQK